MASGEHIYKDFTLPIPPGSFALMAAFQSVTGRFFLLDELWLCAICQMAMLGIGYGLVRPFTTERNAILTTIATIPMLISTPKEIAYDHTALVIAWLALLLMTRGLLIQPGRARGIWIACAGFAASCTLLFKSSTGVGAVAAVCLGIVGISWIGIRTEGRQRVRHCLRDIAHLGAGLLTGAVLTLLTVVAIGGSISEFYQVVFVDGPLLKGGSAKAISNLFSYAVVQTPVHLSFLFVLIMAGVCIRIIKTDSPFLIDSNARSVGPEQPSKRWWLFAVPMSLYLIAVFGYATWLLASNADGVPFYIKVGAAFGSAGPMIGLTALLLLIAVNYAKSTSWTDRKAVFVMVGLSAGMLSLMHNLSDPKHRPLYDNNPIIPLAIVAILILVDQARASVLKYVIVCTMLLAMFGTKYQRYLEARHPVQDHGFWAGLKVSERGTVLIDVANRARELAGPEGTVLQLPEDPMFSAMIDRPRPKLRGAIVFVDQYPSRMLVRDLETLRSDPPKVLVLHPENDSAWGKVYGIWSNDSPAAKLHTTFVREHLDAMYRYDGSYPATFFEGGDVSMALFVRR